MYPYDDVYDPSIEEVNPETGQPLRQPAQPTPPAQPGTEQPRSDQRSQLARLAAQMRGYQGDAAPLPVPAGGDEPKSPLMEEQQKQFDAGAKGYGASSGDIMSLLSMFV